MNRNRGRAGRPPQAAPARAARGYVPGRFGKEEYGALIRAVLFNLDGIIVSSDECHYRAWQRLAKEQGIPFTDQLSRQIAGMKRMDSLKILLKKAERSYSPGEMWALSARKNDLFNELILKLTPESVKPGVQETMDALHLMDIRTAVASCSENATGILRQLKIEALFDAVIDGGQLTEGKPDPEAFLLAARKLSAPTGDCLVVENTLAGIEAARAAGMKFLAMGEAAREKGLAFHPKTLWEMNLPAILAAGMIDRFVST